MDRVAEIETDHGDMILTAFMSSSMMRKWTFMASGWRRAVLIAQFGSLMLLGFCPKVNSIAWCPATLGQLLACASSDGDITILLYCDGSWTSQRITGAHRALDGEMTASPGVTAISWAPTFSAGSLANEDRFTSDDLPLAQLASSGADGLVKIWSLIRNDISLSTSQEDNIMNAEWSTIPRELDGHDGKCVRDVAWAPSIGLASSTIASCAADRVVIWKQDVENPKVWNAKLLSSTAFEGTIWSVSWSITGSILAVSHGENKVTLWKEDISGDWINISNLQSSINI